MAVKYANSLWPEQLRRRCGQSVWVSKVGTHFWPDITKGAYRTVTKFEKQANGEVVCFSDGRRLLLKELGTTFVCFDARPAQNDRPICHGDTLALLREAVSAMR